jgi:hypothetical protein
MENEQLISVEQFCTHYQVDVSFIETLTEFGLIEVVTIETKPWIDKEQIIKLEKLTHLYYDLDINIEGIDAIHHLLEKVQQMQLEIKTLKNRLRFYEPE